MGRAMLTEIELGLVQLIKTSPLGDRLRMVGTLPDLEGDSLVTRFNNDAPAVYVALGSFPVRNSEAQPKYGIACVAKNSRGHQAARHGDGIAIGLHEMLEAVMVIADNAVIEFGEGESASAVGFSVVSCDLVASEKLYEKGIYAGVVQIESTADVRLEADLGRLADFKTFQADYDILPPEAAAEHAKWLKEPPDHSTSAPDLSDTLKLQE